MSLKRTSGTPYLRLSRHRYAKRAFEVAGNIFLVAAIVVAVVSIVYFGIVA